MVNAKLSHMCGQEEVKQTKKEISLSGKSLGTENNQRVHAALLGSISG